MSAKNTTNSLVFQIDQLLDEASKLAETESDSAKFFAALLHRSVLAVQAQSAAIWMLGPDSYPVAISTHQPRNVETGSPSEQLANHQAIRQSIESGDARNVVDRSKSAGPTSMFCCPYDSGAGSIDSAIALYFSEQVDPELATVYASFTEAIAEIAAEHGRSNQSARTITGPSSSPTGSTSEWNKFKSLSDGLHESLDIRSTALSLVNLGRSFYSCDRVMLAQKSGRAFKVIAASGAATVNRKSETVAAIESLVSRGFYRNDKPIALQHSSPTPPAIEKAFEQYQSASSYDFLLLFPLSDQNGQVKFVQIIESADENKIGEILKRVKVAEPQTRSAFKNVAQYQAIPFRRLLGAIGSSRPGSMLGRIFGPLAFLGLLSLAIASMCLIQTDLIISAEGNVVSESEKSVFAANDGVITKLHVEHGDHVRTGELLVEMSSNEIESGLGLLKGDIETERKRLSAIEAVKSSIDRGTREGQRELGRLSSQEIESQQQIENLNIELTQLEMEKQRLQLKSPLDGIVVTRDVKAKLLDRPVDRGSSLLQLIASDGKWLAKIRVPDSRISHLMNRLPEAHEHGEEYDARETSRIPVTLSIATHPEKEFAGVIRDVSNVAEVDERTGQAFIMTTIELSHDDDITFQPGSSAIAEFNCGTTSIGYAWFNEFIDSIRYRFF